jgi:transposase
MTELTRAMTIGIDLGDKVSRVCVLDEAGEVSEESRLRTTEAAIRQRFTGLPRARIAFEVSTHSPWVQRVLAELGHETIVANATQVRLIAGNDRKDDRIDAERLARLARVDPRLLSPIEHRGVEIQRDRAVVRSRDALVRCRTLLVNHVRGVVKATGARLGSCSATSFHKQVAARLPEELKPAVEGVIATIADLTIKIREYDRRIEQLCEGRYPETALLRQVTGVGALTSLAYVLRVDRQRFSSSRAVGPYLGLGPRRSQSGDRDPELRISKKGDSHVRRLLVGSAHYILGPFGPDTDLRRWGLQLAARGGKNAKKRAVVAVARKLAVLLHRLWVTGEVYEPLRNTARHKKSQRSSTAA